MQDSFGRKIDYLRISVTDRCNFRCSYCMPERQKFLPHGDLLDYREITDLTSRFIDHGIRKLRLTGGEPLVRKDIDILLRSLGAFVHSGQLDELTLTTNGSRLIEFLPALVAAGVKRINVSLDSLDSQKFARITRGGDLEKVLAGIKAATSEGISVRINMVALKNQNEADLVKMAEYCAANGHDLAVIETMPLGSEVGRRTEQYISLDEFIAPLLDTNNMQPIAHSTAGPARYFKLDPLELRLGLITPMSRNFCNDCNRLRLTTDGKIFMCLGSSLHVDLRKTLREDGLEAVDLLLQTALRLKPERHDFEQQMARPELRLSRHMNATGG